MEKDEVPQVSISLKYHPVKGLCWCELLGSHVIPIRNGMYGENVDACTVIGEVKTLAGGKVRVQWVR